MKHLYDNISLDCSKNMTRKYSTSFSLGIRFLAPELQKPIYQIYAYVRLADEIVDSFEGYQQEKMLSKLKVDTFEALEEGISTNPVIHSFQEVVNQYQIDHELIDAFLYSMNMDLSKQEYNLALYEKYIYGSAEVVGLMCLRVFTQNDDKTYQALKQGAMKLGSAFQKINFLRDLKDDYSVLGRIYFPGTDFNNFCDRQKKEIEQDIERDFQEGLKGIKQLPQKSKFGVYLAYIYFHSLFKKIKSHSGEEILKVRIRIPNSKKFSLLMYSYFCSKLRLIG